MQALHDMGIYVMPSLKDINREAGTDFKRWRHVAAALKEHSMARHYQIRVTDYGQMCLRAPAVDQIIGMLWRVNRHGGRSGGGHFGRAVLFPAQMRPGQNSDIDYRIPDGDGFAYFTGKLPEFPTDPITREYLPSAHEWQWIDAQPGERREAFWYGTDDVLEIPVSEYDTWLLTGEPMPGTVVETPAPDADYAKSVRDRRQAIEARQPYLSVANAAAEMGFSAEFLGQIESGVVAVEDWHKDNIERVLDAWAWVLE